MDVKMMLMKKKIVLFVYLQNTSMRSLTSDSPPTEIVVTTTGLSRETRDWAEKVAKDLNWKISEKFTNKGDESSS